MASIRDARGKEYPDGLVLNKRLYLYQYPVGITADNNVITADNNKIYASGGTN